MQLYTYYRSSSSYRLRIALNLKGVAYEPRFIHLRNGDQFGDDYAKLNPQQQVPTLVLDDGTALVQSPAIIEWLEEAYPDPPLLPKDALGRYRVRALAAVVGTDIHPIDNLRVLKYVGQDLGASPEQVEAWFNNWIVLGFNGLEKMLADSPDTGTFCHGDSPTIADTYLVPQVFNAGRYKLSLDPYPTIKRIYAACQELEAFQKAAPKAQPDWEDPS
jgi:maleylacetoacetate isomerase